MVFYGFLKLTRWKIDLKSIHPKAHLITLEASALKKNLQKLTLHFKKSIDLMETNIEATFLRVRKGEKIKSDKWAKIIVIGDNFSILIR
tara:strand:+ start:390 stop:656 length:267 start_codon:yes stop_codon:yes gene_type:complete